MNIGSRATVSFSRRKILLDGDNPLLFHCLKTEINNLASLLHFRIVVELSALLPEELVFQEERHLLGSYAMWLL
jgi:hypothetical protein